MIDPHNTRLSRKTTISLFVFVSTLLWAGLFAGLDPDWHHDGILFKPATDVANGLHLFSETYTQYGALTTYLQGFAISVFGKHLIVLRYEAVFFLAVTGVLLFLIFRRLVPNSISLFIVILWLLMAPYLVATFFPWSSIYSLTFMMLGVWLLLKVDDYSSKPYLQYLLCFLAGSSLVACFWARQPTGIVVVTIGLYFLLLFLDRAILWLDVVRQFLSYSFGIALTSAVFLFWFMSVDSLDDWWIQSILGAKLFTEKSGFSKFNLASILGYLFPKPNTVWLSNYSNVWRILPAVNLFIVVFLIGILIVKRELGIKFRTLLLVCLLSIGSWAQYYPVVEIRKVYWAATPMFGVIITAMYFTLRSFHISFRYSSTVIVVLTALFFYRDIDYRLSYALTRFPTTYIEFPTLEGMRFSNNFVKTIIRYSGDENTYYSDLRRLGQLLYNVRELDPNRSLLTITGDAYLTAVLNNQNAHTITLWDRPWMSRMYPEYWSAIRSFIRLHRPLIEIKTKRWGFDGYDWTDEKLPARIDLGFSDYELMIQSDYSDSGTVQILAPPEFLITYQEIFGLD